MQTGPGWGLQQSQRRQQHEHVEVAAAGAAGGRPLPGAAAAAKALLHLQGLSPACQMVLPAQQMCHPVQLLVALLSCF